MHEGPYFHPDFVSQAFLEPLPQRLALPAPQILAFNALDLPLFVVHTVGAKNMSPVDILLLFIVFYNIALHHNYFFSVEIMLF